MIDSSNSLGALCVWGGGNILAAAAAAAAVAVRRRLIDVLRSACSTQ